MYEDSFGDVTGEYFALRDGVGRVEGVHGLVWVEGPDSVSFLEGLLSQDVAGLAPGDVVAALLLSPQGKLRAPLTVLGGEERIGLVCAADAVSTVVEDLGRYKIRVKAEIRPEVPPIVDVIGPESAAALRGIGFDVADGWTEVDAGGVIATIPLGPLSRHVVSGAAAAAIAEAGLRQVGRLAFHAVRIEAGEPMIGVDIDEKTIPQEAGLVEAGVSFTKGCYLGQELVARIDSRGHVNRHLRGVAITANVLPPVGAQLHAEGRQVGTLTSVAESLAVGAPIALGLIRREVAPGDEVRVTWDGGEVAAVVHQLPFDAFGAEYARTAL